MATTPEIRRWEELFAQRTRSDVGDGIAFVLGFLGRSDLISFAGGFPDPKTFPRERASPITAAASASPAPKRSSASASASLANASSSARRVAGKIRIERIVIFQTFANRR